MKKLLLVVLALAGTIQINAWHGRGGWGHRRGWGGWGWNRPYYGPGYGYGYYGRGSGLIGDLALTGAVLATADREPKSSEYYETKNKENQRREFKKQIEEVKRDLRRNPNDKDLKAELNRLREDLRHV